MREKGGVRERWGRHGEVYRQVLSYFCIVNNSGASLFKLLLRTEKSVSSEQQIDLR